MTHDQIFSLMEAFIASVKGRLLTGYPNDFFVHDREYLQANWNSASRMIWVVTPNGTHLNEIGLHSKQNSFADATLHTGYRDQAIFLVDNRGLHPVSKETAAEACKQLDYAIDGNLVKDRTGQSVAAFSLKAERRQGRQGGTVEFTLSGAQRLSCELRHALNAIAISEMVRHYGSWFCHVDEVVIHEGTAGAHAVHAVPIQELSYA